MRRLVPQTLATLATLAAAPALASSDDAWAEFRTAVAAACTPLADAPADATVEVEVNPFGSESYGVAIVTVTMKDGETKDGGTTDGATNVGGTDRMVCIYDKTARTAEITAPFTPTE